MIRAVIVSVVGVLLACAAVRFAGAAALPAYLAAWLVFLAVPAGALPIVLGLELAGHGGSRHTGYLRWLLMLMPVAALAALPVLLGTHDLYRWTPGGWWSEPFFQLRTLITLIVWTTLCLINVRPPATGGRTALSATGLVLHLAIGTLAASDWIGSLSPGLASAELGLLLMSAQCVIALALAILLSAARPPFASTLLAASAIAWGILAFLQYLIVWSANRPAEIIWYQQRGGTAGELAAWFAAASVALCAILFGPGKLADAGLAVSTCAGLLLAALSAHMLWLTLPSIHHGSAPVLADLPGEASMLLLACAALWAWHPRRAGR